MVFQALGAVDGLGQSGVGCLCVEKLNVRSD